ncbi:hypothetical protein ACJX0J_029987, partial [Zea mays]
KILEYADILIIHLKDRVEFGTKFGVRNGNKIFCDAYTIWNLMLLMLITIWIDIIKARLYSIGYNDTRRNLLRATSWLWRHIPLLLLIFTIFLSKNLDEIKLLFMT